MTVQTARIAVTTIGSAGSATGTDYSTSSVDGEVFAIRVDWHASAPGATSDIVITVDSDDYHPSITLYSKSDSATDAWVYPVVQSTDTAGSAVAGQYQHILASGKIKVAITGCNALTDAAVVYVYLRR